MNAEAIRDRLVARMADEFSFDWIDGRLAVDTPVGYPDGASVVVYVWEREPGKLEVTDYGEGYQMATDRRGMRSANLRSAATAIAADEDLVYARGRFSTVVADGEVEDAIWRMARASSRLADAPTFQRAAASSDDDFAGEVESSFRARNASIEREPTLEGLSGHKHRPALYVPAAQLVVEPISAKTAWIRAAAVYAEFGDLSQANGYNLLAVLDDRESGSSEQTRRLLTQVGDVVEWTRRDAWLKTVLPSRPK